jgi:hypothetical protein
LTTHGTVLRLDAIQGNILVILFGQNVSVSDTIDSSLGIFVSVWSSLVVPLQSQINVLWRMNAQLVEVTHGKFSSWETGMGSSVGVDIRQFFMLWEKTFMANEEPLADSHISFRLTLFRSKAVVMQWKSRVEFTSERSQFVRRCHFELSFWESAESRIFDVPSGLLLVVWHNAFRELDLR